MYNHILYIHAITTNWSLENGAQESRLVFLGFEKSSCFMSLGR